MDHYHQTTPPTRLKSEVLGAAGSRKSAPQTSHPLPTAAIDNFEQKILGSLRKIEGMGECDEPLDFARVKQALEGGGQ